MHFPSYRWLSGTVKDISRLTRSVRRQRHEFFGRDCQTMFCQVCNTNLVTFAIVGLAGKEERTYRLTMRLVSGHFSQWDFKFSGKWDSALKGCSPLRAHDARAAGIELAHGKSMTAYKHICWFHSWWQEVTRSRYWFWALTQIAEMSSSWQRIQRRHHWLCPQHSGRLSPELLCGRCDPCLHEDHGTGGPRRDRLPQSSAPCN